MQVQSSAVAVALDASLCTLCTESFCCYKKHEAQHDGGGPYMHAVLMTGWPRTMPVVTAHAE